MKWHETDLNFVGSLNVDQACDNPCLAHDHARVDARFAEQTPDPPGLDAAVERLDARMRESGAIGPKPWAWAVLADDGMDPPRREADAHVDESLDVPVFDGDVTHLDRVRLGAHRGTRRRRLRARC